MESDENVLYRTAITTVVAKRLRVCSREPLSIGTSVRRRKEEESVPKVTVVRWATIAIGIACSRNILTRESPPFDARGTSLRYESIIHPNEFDRLFDRRDVPNIHHRNTKREKKRKKNRWRKKRWLSGSMFVSYDTESNTKEFSDR